MANSETLLCGSGIYIRSLFINLRPIHPFPLTTTTTMYTSEAYPAAPRTLMLHPSSYHYTPPCSLPTSPPLTSPPLKHAGSPYERSPLPPVPEDYSPPLPSINRILRYSLKPNVSFDLLHHPSTITTLPDHRLLSLRTLAEPATNPPLPHMTVVSPHLPWSITISPPLPHKANKFVTVSDVLVTLHRALALTVTVTEYGNLPSEDAVVRVNAAWERRVKDITDGRAREIERRKGVKRCDFLMDRHRFLGLSKMGRDPDVFVLNVF
jgi:hypothetical protein